MLIDGAHAVGALELDVPAIGASFYTANLHKWLCTPKGTAFLWVHPSEQHSMRPPVTSHGQGQVLIHVPSAQCKCQQLLCAGVASNIQHGCRVGCWHSYVQFAMLLAYILWPCLLPRLALSNRESLLDDLMAYLPGMVQMPCQVSTRSPAR